MISPMARAKPPSPFIWSRLSRSRQRRPALGPEAIARAAVRIADKEGLGALSMRRVAGSLGAGAMSLYRHVASKDELLDLMLDAAFAELEVPERPSGDWQKDLRSLARRVRTVLRRHPWMAQLVTSRPTLGPSYLRWFDFSLGVAMSSGADIKTAVRVVGTLNAYVSGVVAYELGDSEARRRHGLSEAQMRTLVAPYLKQVMASGRYPNLAPFLREGTGEATDEDFEWGLTRVLDGLAKGPLSGRKARTP